MTDQEGYIWTTLGLMESLGIGVRDTFASDYNFDDFYSNGRQFDGPRLFAVEYDTSVTYPQIRTKGYAIPGFDDTAYDRYTILLPDSYKTNGRDDAIVHECTHFLQCNTPANDAGYLYFDGTNYIDYVSQRTEMEAHLVQIAFIVEERGEYLRGCVEEAVSERVLEHLAKCKSSRNSAVALDLILKCKHYRII